MVFTSFAVFQFSIVYAKNRNPFSEYKNNNFVYYIFLVEQSLNSLPHVPVSSDATELDALAPNHFLLGAAASTLPSHQHADVDHRKRYARAQAYSDAIWSRWLKDYVPSFNRRSKWSNQSARELKTGDLVWIVEPSSPRGHYPLACVVRLKYGKSSVGRSAELETATGSLVRPVVKLAPVLPHDDSPNLTWSIIFFS